MILALDVGNTNIVLGCLDREKTFFIERLSTVRTKTELEYAIDFKTVLDIYQIQPESIDGCIISSVVPQITSILKRAAGKILMKKPVMALGPGIKTGLNILMDNPATVGADLVAAAVAGIDRYPVPLILIDMGTATTVTVVDDKKRYIGGMIYPGLMVSLDALTAHAAQLGGISLDPPRKIIAKNTTESMRSGILYSNAAALDGVIDRMEDELGGPAGAVVATGGLASKIIPLCRRKITLDEDLILKGLLLIYEKNR